MKLDTLIEAAKVAIKKMLVEQNSIKAMEKQEFESRFTSQVYSLLDICLL